MQTILSVSSVAILVAAIVWWHRRPDPKWWGKITPAPNNKNKKG